MKIGFAKLTVFAVLSAINITSAASASTIADWNFQTDALAGNNNPVADIGSGTATSIGMNIYPTPNVGVTACDVLLGVTADTGSNGLADTGNIWRVRAALGPNGAANGWSSLAPVGSQGATFVASTVGYTGPINVSFDWYATNQGEANMQLQYTTDGTTWHNLPVTIPGADTPAVLLNNTSSPNTVMGYYVSGGTQGQAWFPNLTATINDPSADGNPNFAIEMVNASTGADCVAIKSGTPLNNNSGNWRFDNVSISATAVPEPSTLALLAVGTAGIATCLRRRRSH